LSEFIEHLPTASDFGVMCPISVSPTFKLKRILMAKPNYTFEKRQKEIAKKKKKEEKRLKKLEQGTEEAQAEQPPISESI